jgi:hypothetical protein
MHPTIEAALGEAGVRDGGSPSSGEVPADPDAMK